MAINNGFGLHVALHVKKSNPMLAKEVQDALTNTNRKFHIDIKKVNVTNAVLGETQTRIQNYFDKRTFNLKINRIDASDAINNVRQQLAQMVEAFRLDNGVNIKGIGLFTDGAYEAAYQRRAAAAERAARATRDEASAERQVFTEAQATAQQMSAKAKLLERIDRLQQSISSFRGKNPDFANQTTGIVDGKAVTQMDAYVASIETLRQNVLTTNAANQTAMQQWSTIYDTKKEVLSQYNAQVAESGRIEVETEREVANAAAARNDVTREQIIARNNLVNQIQALQDPLLKAETTLSRMDGGAALQERLDELRVRVVGLANDTKNTVASDDTQLTLLRQRYVALIDIVKSFGREVEAARMKDPSAVSGLNTTQLLGSLETATNKAMSLTNNEGFLQIIDTLKTKVYELQEKITTFSRTGQGDVQALRSEFEQYRNAIESLNKIGLVGAARNDPSAGDAGARSASQNLNFIRQVESAAKQARSLLSNNTKLLGTDLGSTLQDLIDEYDEFIQRIINSPPKTKAEFDNLKAEFDGMKEGVARVGIEMEQAGIKGNTMLTRFAQGIKKFGGWTIVTRALTAVIRLGRQLVTNVKEIDTAMTQLRIVTKATESEIKSFTNSVAQAAKETGSSMTDLIDSATTYARLGYTLNESSALAEYTSMLKTVGAIDVSDAQDAITAITKAFNIDVNNIESVMDKLVEVGNNFPISVSQIAEGLNNASSALAGAGNTFEQSVALLTAANTTVDYCRAA